jgi:hypothetical protein
MTDEVGDGGLAGERQSLASVRSAVATCAPGPWCGREFKGGVLR